MGGAFMAVDDEIAAMAWNPAGLSPPACRGGTRFRVHVNILGAPSIVRETGLLTGVETEPFASLPAVEKLTVALGGVFKAVTVRRGAFVAGALFLEEHLDPLGLAEAKGLADAEDLLGGYYTSLVFAFRLAPTVSIGACETVLSGWDDVGERVTGSGRAYGAMLSPNDRVTVGLTYVDLPPEFGHYREVVEGLAPRTMNAGVAYRPSTNVLIAFDLRDLAENHPGTSLEPRLGIEWSAWGSVAIRAGAFREQAGESDVLSLGLGAIPMAGCPEGSNGRRAEASVLNYAVLLSADRAPRHLLSAILHF
jgi:hypothetical protein